MKDKPQTIKTTVWSEFSNLYINQLIAAIKRKFKIDLGIEPDFLSESGQSELIIRFLANDEDASLVYEYIISKWQFVSEPELVS
ncbi:hypothetical protein [uncultured Enterococcus sp.]|uniref:hypothetical protein n=1 Tax=uncultured Enterococcus sp. TaxID=167972 RepID=UPI00258FA929|nr:hypothetical protein [uncultured Enterococcus sp.]